MKHNHTTVWRCLGAALMTSATVVAFVHNSPARQQQRETTLVQYQSYFRQRQIITCTNKKNNRHLSSREGDYDHDDVHLLSELRHTSFNALLERIPPSVQIVLIGEGTHGTEEFFRIRSEVTQCLLQNHGFNAIVCEGDVQPFFELNKFVTENQEATSNDNDTTMDDPETLDRDSIRSMLSHLFSNRFPNWMWSNIPMVSLLSWLKSNNNNNPQKNASTPSVQLLGMDIQSPFDSMDYIIRELSAMGEKEVSDSVRKLYGPLFRYRNDIRRYGNDVYGNKVPSLENAVKAALDALLQKHDEKFAFQSAARSTTIDDDDAPELLPTWFRLIQNGHAIKASEAYHRQRIYPGHTATWNVRTESMMDAITRSMEYIDKMNRINATAAATSRSKEDEAHLPPVRLIVWAHNSHVGDMRSTGYSSLGQISLGQLCREHFGDDDVFLIGMTTYEGTVRAARADLQSGACWKGEGEDMTLKKAAVDSHESVLHSIATKLKSDNRGEEEAFGIYLRGMRGDACISETNIENRGEVSFNCDRDERFVGSCYLPQTEKMSHYTTCNMATQFDCIIHVDESSAINV